ncbi:LCP family protein [Lacticaseibacillus songhuajiangensis]|jgi:LCP family protein required for cell wall assembly|uniref:LCP family protein n=1 Tax=Lacticaseibacillus songhuajiangensis TaxID=1296539 RepID=UPI000F795303|nr:LCP family protein [Lacticaseibacillus songhuajiangensis]
MENKRRPRKPERQLTQHRLLRLVLLALAGLLFVVGAYGFRMYNDARNTVNNSFVQIAGRKQTKKIKATKPLSFLLIGTDTGALGRKEKLANSDTLMVVTINPKTNKTTIVSVPRDTMAQIQDGTTNNIQKINASFMAGGSTCAVKTVEKLLNLKIDYYVTVNMGGLSKIVDAVGGVDVDVPFSWSDPSHDGGTFKKGKAHLNGARALQFARMRYKDPDGDNGRQRRQQQVIMAIVKAILSANSLTNYKSVLSSLKGNLQMNLTFDNLVSIANGYRNAAKHVTKTQIKENGAWIGDASYQIASTKELQRVSDMLRTQMGESKETLDNENVRQNKLNSSFDFSSGNNPRYYIFDQYGNILK